MRFKKNLGISLDEDRKIKFDKVVFNKKMNAEFFKKMKDSSIHATKKGLHYGYQKYSAKSRDVDDELSDFSTEGSHQISNHYLKGMYQTSVFLDNFRKKRKLKREFIKKRMDSPNNPFRENVKLSKKKAHEDWKHLSSDEKKFLYNSKNIKSMNLYRSGLNLANTRFYKTTGRWSHSNNFDKKMVAKSYNLARGTKQSYEFAKKGVSFVKNFRTMMVGMINGIASIMTAIVMFITSIPILIILIVMLVFLAILNSFDYSGRVNSFIENEVYLEYRYETNVAPDEILSITSALNWSTHRVEDYEVLFALLLDGKDDNWNISYEQMLDNVFKKYNPAFDGYHPSIRVKRRTILGNFVEENLKYEDYLNIYPDFLNNKEDFGTPEKINSLKNLAKESLEKNAFLYANKFFPLEENYFHPPISQGDLTYHASTFKIGYRNILDGDFHGGVDIAAASGTHLYAVADAEVIYVENNIVNSGDSCAVGSKNACGKNFGGNQIVFKIPFLNEEYQEQTNLYVAYYHLEANSIQVKVGDVVKAGDFVGKVGNSGLSFGSHLHLQSWIDKKNQYDLPYSSSKKDFEVWGKMIDLSMFFPTNYRNFIYGR